MLVTRGWIIKPNISGQAGKREFSDVMSQLAALPRLQLIVVSGLCEIGSRYETAVSTLACYDNSHRGTLVKALNVFTIENVIVSWAGLDSKLVRKSN